MKLRAVLLVLLFAAAIAAGAWLLRQKPSATRSVSGTIEVDEARIGSRYGGRVEKVLAREGDLLKAGQVIAELDAAELKARRDYAAATLDKLESGARAEEKEAAKHEWEAQQAELEFARTDAERAKKLFDQHTISETDRDRAVSRARVLEQTTAAAREKYNLLMAGARPEEIAQAEALLAEVETQLREMRIVAPSDCFLEVLSAKTGDLLRPNQEVATVLLTQHVWVRVYVPELWLGHIQQDEPVQVRADSIRDREFTGQVEQISRQAEFTPRNVQTEEDRIRQVFGVKVRLPSDSPLRAGMSVDVFFPDVPAPPK